MLNEIESHLQQIQELETCLATAKAKAQSLSEELRIFENLKEIKCGLIGSGIVPQNWRIQTCGEKNEKIQLNIGYHSRVWQGSSDSVDIFRKGQWVHELAVIAQQIRERKALAEITGKRTSLESAIQDFAPLES